MGLNILRYGVAISYPDMGCISPKMTLTDEEQLIEVGRYMISLNIAFVPENRSTRNEYDFQLLETTIQAYGLHKYWNHFLQTIVFDALIGNTDRHQENWALIGKTTVINEMKDVVHQIDESKNYKDPILKLLNTPELKVAPIYDSGSSLGRELTDERIKKMLAEETEINKYINNGKSEIHWKGRKVSHFKLISNLLESSYGDALRTAASFLNKISSKQTEEIVNSIDIEIPESLASYRVPTIRKQLIIKLLNLRLQRLKEIIHG